MVYSCAFKVAHSRGKGNETLVDFLSLPSNPRLEDGIFQLVYRYYKEKL